LTLTVSPNTSTVCPGTPVTLTASGATNYTWSPSATLSSANGTTVTATPSVNTTYTVLGATGTCTGTATAVVTIGGSLTLTVTPNTSTVCPGTPVILTASGATNYTWSPSATLSSANGATVTANPLAGTTYTVLGASGTCTGSATANISMSAGLTLTLTSNTPTICPNGSALLDANGATSYTWFPSSTLSSANGSNVTASPLVNTTYTVLGSTGTCTGIATVSVGIGVCVSSACDLALIRSTLTAAGNIELLGMNNTCSLYFINPQFMTGPQAQAYAQSFGANLISVQSASENADLVQALSNQGYASNVIWIGYSDAVTEGSYVWYDGAPLSYSNWAPGEPNDAGGVEDCTQIYPDGSWNDLNCVGYNSLSVIEVNICPQVSVVNVPPTHCPLTNVTMNASTLLGSPNYTYTWVQSGTATFTTSSTGSSLNDQITVTSNGANTFTVFTEDRYSCPQSTTVSLNVFPTPTITTNSSTICVGQQTATLTANGASTYTWSAGLSATTGSVVTGSPASSQNYTVVGTDGNGCLNGTVTAIAVNSLPTISVNNASICIGQQTATLTANGANTYSWTPSADLSSSTGSLVTGNPIVTQTYSVIGTDLNGCFNTNTSTITVNSLPIISTNSSTICVGQQTATLTANGATTYSWIPGTGLSSTTGSIVTGTPLSSENYTVVGMDANGCISGTTTAITVNSLPTITVNSSTICVGQQTATLTANGADTYSWTPATGLSATTGSIVTGTPNATQNYTVGGIDANGCINATVTAIAVNPLPTLLTSANSTVCPLSSNTLTVGGAASYTWTPNIYLNTNTSSTVICTPSVTTTYTIDATSIDGCTNSTSLTIVVNNTVVVNASASTPTICPLGSTSLNATGATTYSWSPALNLNTANGATVTSSTPITETYTVIGATGTCTNSAQVVVIVTTNPVVNIVATPSIICSGSSANLTASGASSYTWTPTSTLGSSTGASVTATPNTTTTYSIIGTSALGCIGTSTTSIVVIPTPTISTFGNPLTICAGRTTTLSAVGATNYTWSPSGSVNNLNSSITTANPVLTTTYTAIGTNGVAPNLCSSSSTLQILVIQNPTITAAPKQIICEGQTTLIYANGATNYTWSPSSGVDDINDSTTYINPVGSGVFIYTVTGSNNNCTSTATVEVLVNPLPIVNAGVDTTINIDNTVTLIGIGNTSVGFINASDGTPFSCNYCPTVTVNPQNSTCYTLEGINEFGCRATDVVCVTVTKDWSVFIPNAFTPNGDIHNEVFIPMGYAIDEIKLTIYDRWGHVVFKSNDTVIGWDGTKNGKICEQGVYVYQAEITAMSGEKVIRTGHVTLLGKTK